MRNKHDEVMLWMDCAWEGEWRGAFEQNLCEVKSAYDYIGIEDKCWVGHGGGLCVHVCG